MRAREIDIVRETNRKRVNNTHTHTHTHTHAYTERDTKTERCEINIERARERCEI